MKPTLYTDQGEVHDLPAQPVNVHAALGYLHHTPHMHAQQGLCTTTSGAVTMYTGTHAQVPEHKAAELHARLATALEGAKNVRTRMCTQTHMYMCAPPVVIMATLHQAMTLAMGSHRGHIYTHHVMGMGSHHDDQGVHGDR